jgi:hypothetical protein
MGSMGVSLHMQLLFINKTYTSICSSLLVCIGALAFLSFFLSPGGHAKIDNIEMYLFIHAFVLDVRARKEA